MGQDGAEDERFGTLRSWMVDAGIAGMLLPVAACGLVLGWTLVTEPGTPSIRKAIPVFVLAAVLGGVLALGLAPGLRWAVRASWRVTPVLAFALGPVAGAFCAVVVVCGIVIANDGFLGLRWGDLGLLLGFGGVALGPPWVAYVAVRAARRRGTAVAVASSIWMVAPVAILIVVEEISRL